MNLFLQYKTPEKLVASHASEWSSWKSPYFRYRLDKNQRDILVNIDSHAYGSSLVFYGSPAFIEALQLWKRTLSGDILLHSNFVPASYLAGHSRYTYVDAVGLGRGHSEPKDFPIRPFTEVVLEGIRSGPDMSLAQAMASAVKQIRAATEGDDQLSATFRSVMALDLPPRGDQFVSDLRTIRAFEMVTGIRLHILG